MLSVGHLGFSLMRNSKRN